MKKPLIIFIGLLVLGSAIFLLSEYYLQKNKQASTDNNIIQNEEPTVTTTPDIVINNFQDCVDAGNLILESYPRQCNTQDGQHFTEEVGNVLQMQDQITLSSPLPNDFITSPLTITGDARGTWFFEASFPIVLTNWDGLIIAEGYATADSDWMTEEFVPFTANLEFDIPDYKNNGSLILKKDNPSGLPENDAALEIPVFFETK